LLCPPAERSTRHSLNHSQGSAIVGDLPGRHRLGGGAEHHGAIGDVELAAVAWAVDRAVGDLADQAGFQNGGTLAALYVNVGDTVKRGQVLAKEDTFEADQALTGAQTQLAMNQSQLEQVLHDVTITQSRRILARDRDIQGNTKRVEATRHSADEYAVRQAQKQLDTDERVLQQAIAACELNPPATAATAPAAPSSADGLTGTLANATSTTACSSDPTAQATVQADRTGVRNAQYTERLDYLNDQASIKSAGVTVAYDEVAVAVEVAHRPADIANARGAVTNQEAAVAKAQRDVDDTTLRAPVDSQVASTIGTLLARVSWY
jgi:multidrug efflux pump subunit AcrA (membrane-fusion protein)